MASVTPIDPISDPRVEHKTTVLNGHTYHYIFGVPKSGQFKATIVLVHGWPDLSFGWRYQIPALIEMGYRVAALDMMGYGGTDAPRVPPESNISFYGFKRASDDIAELARQLNAPQIVLGGHDWGGAVVYRVALWYPKLVSHIFAISTPYSPPSKTYMSIEDVVNGPLPQFRYQLQLAAGDAEVLTTKEELRNFMKFVSGGRGPNGEYGFHPLKGIILENLPKLERGPFMTEKELDFYAEQYSKNGLNGPLSWYRTRKVNYEEELALTNPNIDAHVLFIATAKDAVLKPEMSLGMEKFIPNLTRSSVDANHFGQWEKPDEINQIIKDWSEKVVFAGEKSSL
ncbi:epoxide hydrolase-like protein [Phyllosticta capitalensis]|uniref:epoxide hydrolase n=1 Tax=Phyllosticta capitalensis TaxID=121624 RepID=UPI003131A0FD